MQSVTCDMIFNLWYVTFDPLHVICDIYFIFSFIHIIIHHILYANDDKWYLVYRPVSLKQLFKGVVFMVRDGMVISWGRYHWLFHPT